MCAFPLVDTLCGVLRCVCRRPTVQLCIICPVRRCAVFAAHRPALVIGVPVGFVNVVESKELIIANCRAPYIVARGRKGGSNVAAAICNAMLYQIRR